MAARTEVRLVCCPKCSNLLPELSDYPVYQCGGCDAVLRAKKKVTVDDDGSMEQIEKDRDGGIFEKLENFSEKDCGESRIKRDSDGAINSSIKERVFRERTLNLVSSSSSIAEKIEASAHNGCGYVEERNGGYHGGGLGDNNTNMRSSEHVYLRRKEGIREAPGQLECSSGFLRPKVIMDQSGLNRYANRGVADDRRKFSNFVYPDEGPSNYHLNSSYGYGVPEHERAKLRRKLNELKEQIIKSCVLGEEQKGRSPVNRKESPRDPYNGHVAYSVPMQNTAPSEQTIPPYVKQYGHRPAFHANNSDMNMQNFCFHPKHTPNIFPTYEDPLQLQMRSTHSYQLAYDHFSAQSCCNQNWHVPSPFPPNVFGDRKFTRDSSDSNFSHHANSATFRLQSRNGQCDSSAPQLQAQQMHSRWQSVADSDYGAFRRSHPSRVVVNHGKRQCCLPIAGGAPFITCSNCFQLVKLPIRLKTREKNRQKLRCGACLMISLVEVENNRLIVSLPLKRKKKSDEDDDDGSREFLKQASGCHAKATGLSKELRFHLSEPEKSQNLAASSSISSEDEERLLKRNIHGDISSAELPRTDQYSYFQQHLGDLSSDHAANTYGEGNGRKWINEAKAKVVKNSAVDYWYNFQAGFWRCHRACLPWHFSS